MRMKNVLLIVMSMTKLLINVIIYFILFYLFIYFIYFLRKRKLYYPKRKQQQHGLGSFHQDEISKIRWLNPRSKEPKNKYKKKRSIKDHLARV